MSVPARRLKFATYECHGDRHNVCAAAWKPRPTPFELGCRRALVVYLGDFDPSGEDMVRDIGERLWMFTNTGVLFHDNPLLVDDIRVETKASRTKRKPELDVDVHKLALTMEQIDEYEPPPNPVKLSDGRARKFIEEHGQSSWEVDALPPTVLRDIIVSYLSDHIDADKVEEIVTQEDADKKTIQKMLRSRE